MPRRGEINLLPVSYTSIQAQKDRRTGRVRVKTTRRFPVPVTGNKKYVSLHAI